MHYSACESTISAGLFVDFRSADHQVG